MRTPISCCGSCIAPIQSTDWSAPPYDYCTGVAKGSFYAPQNLVEFWRVCTRPVSANGFGLSIAETNGRAKVIERLFILAPDMPDVHTQWRGLVVTYAVSGIQVHDARLVAMMRVHGLADLLTLNVADFRRYPGISATHPQKWSRVARRVHRIDRGSHSRPCRGLRERIPDPAAVCK